MPHVIKRVRPSAPAHPVPPAKRGSPEHRQLLEEHRAELERIATEHKKQIEELKQKVQEHETTQQALQLALARHCGWLAREGHRRCTLKSIREDYERIRRSRPGTTKPAAGPKAIPFRETGSMEDVL